MSLYRQIVNALFRPAGVPAQPTRPCASLLGPPARVKRVLLVDDDAPLRWITARFLARAGYSVDVAEDGEMGWLSLCAVSYDLLVTDNNMPRLSGMQLVGRLRHSRMELPVIVASASTELGEADDYPWLRLTAILHKPFSIADLVAVANRAVPLAPMVEQGGMPGLDPHATHRAEVPLRTRADVRPSAFAEKA